MSIKEHKIPGIIGVLIKEVVSLWILGSYAIRKLFLVGNFLKRVTDPRFSQTPSKTLTI